MQSTPHFIKISEDRKKFECSFCNKGFVFQRDESKIQVHINTIKHKKAVKRTEMEKLNTQEDFELDLVKLLIMLMLPFSILDNKIFRKFLHQYTKFSIPYSYNIREEEIIKKMTEENHEKIRKEHE